VGHFLLRQETSELYMVDGTACHPDAGNRRRRTGSDTSNMISTPGPSAGVLYIEINLPPAASISFLLAHTDFLLDFPLWRSEHVACIEP
jgi:hypothetical protein